MDYQLWMEWKILCLLFFNREPTKKTLCPAPGRLEEISKRKYSPVHINNWPPQLFFFLVVVVLLATCRYWKNRKDDGSSVRIACYFIIFCVEKDRLCWAWKMPVVYADSAWSYVELERVRLALSGPQRHCCFWCFFSGKRSGFIDWRSVCFVLADADTNLEPSKSKWPSPTAAKEVVLFQSI